MAVTLIPAASSGGKTLQSITITGTQTWTAPSGVTSIDVLLVGGGGAGGAANTNATYSGGGGGGGGVVLSTLSVTPGTGYTVTIGAGGTRSTTNANGGDGSNSTFGSLLTALGGGGGQGSVQSALSTTGACGGGAANFNASSVAGGGGGALPVPVSLGSTTYTLYGYASPGLQGGRGFQSQPYGFADVSQGGGSFQNLYGGGGGGGSTQGGSSVFLNNGGYNAGKGAIQTNSGQATAGTANFGGGGGGGSLNSFPGAGGSGVCIIKYWA
jgi:hypothetical protein